MLFHGTNSFKSYKSIRKGGFRPGTYFTPFLDSAICFGGKYVFALDLEPDYDKWQIVTNDWVGPDKILYVQKFDVKLLHYNKHGNLELKKRRIKKEGHTFCEHCLGRGEMRSHKNSIKYLDSPGGGAWRTRKDKCILCKKCKGYGWLE